MRATSPSSRPHWHACTVRPLAALVLAALTSPACKPQAAAPPPAPPPAPAPAAEAPWFDAQSGGELGRAYETLSDAHFAEYPGLKAPPLPALRVHDDWSSHTLVSMSADGEVQKDQSITHCLRYAIAGVDIELYAQFEQLARQRGDKVQRIEGALTWSRGDAGSMQNAELSIGPPANDEAEAADTGALLARWCSDYPQAAGSERLLKQLHADWRFSPALEFSAIANAAAVGSSYGRRADRLEASARFSLATQEQAAAARRWLAEHEFKTDALERDWTTRTTGAQIRARVSDWGQLPIGVELLVTTPTLPAEG